jgi:hypothetical protein
MPQPASSTQPAGKRPALDNRHFLRQNLLAHFYRNIFREAFMICRRLSLFAIAVLLAACSLPAQTMPAASANPMFERLKSLVGTWQGKDQKGNVVHLSFELVSGGSVLMERHASGNGAEMISMYSAEGSRIILTHYCSAGNQPTLESQALPVASKQMDFSFVRATGMKTPEDGHMVGLSITFEDKDHLTQIWNYSDHGKKETDLFTFTRMR